MDRQMFANGGYVRRMQAGGDPMMAPPAPQGPGMAPAPVGMSVPQEMPMGEALAGAASQGIDPAVLEQMLSQAAGSFGNLDAAAETENYEEVINSIRGDQASLQDRRQELAGVVGDADAAQTPDSVLTLVQPIMQIAAVDQGIGSVAPEAMNTPVQGDMAGGIMSTVNMADEQPMPGQGGPAPVNFNQGGAVQYFAPGGVALPAETPAGGRLGELYQDRQALYSQILGPQNQQQELEDQRNMTKAQMLFDIAQGGLAFASGAGMPGRSPAEQLAAAFVQPLGNISARAGEFQKFKQGQKRDERALALQALGAAEADFSAEKKSAADAAAAAAERAWKTAENAQSRAHELLKMDKQFAFTKQENETSMNFQERLADRKLAMQRTLQELAGSQSQADIQLRGQLQVELAQLNNQFTRSLQQDRFDFTTSERVATQDYNDSVLAQKFANDKAILALQGAQDQASIKLRQQLEQENLRLGSELRKGEYMLQFENQLERDGIQNAFELSKMDKGQAFSLALADHQGAIAQEAQLRQQVFQAGEAALDRAQREGLQLSQQEFQKLMQQELQAFQMSEADKNRAIQMAGQEIDKMYKDQSIEISKGQLDLGVAAQLLDEQYKLGSLALEAAAAKAVKVGSEAKTDQLQFITDPDRLSKYANDTLGNETALFEQALLDYLKPTSTWNGSAFVQDATPELARQIRSALDARKAAGFEVPSVPGYSTKEVGAGSAGQQPPEMPSNPDSPEFKQGLYSPQTGVNYDSPLWQKIPTNIIDPEVAYQRSTGPGEIPTRISNWVNEWGRELLGLAPMSAENRELVTADKDMNTLREVINTEIINWASEDRVLKASQDALRSLAQDLTPGAFKSDEAVSSTLDSIKGNLGRAFERYAMIDPEYNPQAEGRYSQQQVLGARSRTNAIRSLMAEVIAIENVFNSYLDGLRGGGPASATPGDMNADKAVIMEMLRQNQGGQQ
jgi:hypothetical protein